MVTVGMVRVTALVICAGGIAGMIVTSIQGHNGAAVTFGLITAVAILCSMVAKAVATSTELDVLARTATPQSREAAVVVPAVAGAAPPGSPPAGPPGAGVAPGDQIAGAGAGSARAGAGPAGAGAGPAGGARPEGREPLAEAVEHRLQALAAAGADEAALRQLVGQAVRLGRALAAHDRGKPGKRRGH